MGGGAGAVRAAFQRRPRVGGSARALAALPRLALDAPAATRYRAIRATWRADQVSTLEATVQVLAMLEGPSFDAEPLLDAFGHFVAGVAARQRPQAHSGQA